MYGSLAPLVVKPAFNSRSSEPSAWRDGGGWISAGRPPI